MNHDILVKKLEYICLASTNLKWFKDYLNNRKQFVSFGNNKKSSLQNVNFGVPQGSILGPLLFLIYVNDMCNVSKSIQPIMFADDTNLFFSAKDNKSLFRFMNEELKRFQTWFNANKLSLNVSKTKYSFFHPLSFTDNIPLLLPKLKINNTCITRETTMKFLGVLLDENMTWQNHINCIEKKSLKI